MRKTRGFKLGRKLVKIFKWVIRPKGKPSNYQRLDPQNRKTNTIAKFCNWGRCLTRGAKGLCLNKSASNYTRLDRKPCDDNPVPVSVPKGHLAVYVGQKDDDPHRILVPVIYFNHPLFGKLLKEAEKEYGFNHPGGITIPCPVTEFENVKMKIAAGENCGKTTRKHRL